MDKFRRPYDQRAEFDRLRARFLSLKCARPSAFYLQVEGNELVRLQSLLQRAFLHDFTQPLVVLDPPNSSAYPNRAPLLLLQVEVPSLWLDLGQLVRMRPQRCYHLEWVQSSARSYGR